METKAMTLDEIIFWETSKGARVMYRGEDMGVFEKGGDCNHVLHLLLSVVTFFFVSIPMMFIIPGFGILINWVWIWMSEANRTKKTRWQVKWDGEKWERTDVTA